MQKHSNFSDELHRLQVENARLRALLAQYGISADQPKPTVSRSILSLEKKVELFHSLFRGREDVFARRWYSPSTGKSGYQPVCLHEWNREYCDKKKYKCAECPNREFQSLGYDDIYRHLEGKDPNGRDVVGAYAILEDNTCNFLCCDSMYRKRIHGYKSVGYSITVGNEGLFAEPKTDAIYDVHNFEKVFHDDLASAKRNIVISTIRLRWNRVPRVVDLLVASAQRGVNITFIVAETGHREEDIRQMGLTILHKPECKMLTAIIDQHIGWYGSINPIGKSIEDATAIRLDSSDFASSLLDAIGL